jgi:hypothetical protein
VVSQRDVASVTGLYVVAMADVDVQAHNDPFSATLSPLPKPSAVVHEVEFGQSRLPENAQLSSSSETTQNTDVSSDENVLPPVGEDRVNDENGEADVNAPAANGVTSPSSVGDAASEALDNIGDVANNSLKHLGTTMPVLIDMDKAAVGPKTVKAQGPETASSHEVNRSYDGAVLWEVLLHNSDKEMYSATFNSCEVVRYITRQPVEPTPIVSSTSDDANKTEAAEANETKEIDRTAVLIRRRARARMPGVVCNYPDATADAPAAALPGCNCQTCQDRRLLMTQSATIYNPDVLPQSYAGFEIEHWSNAEIVIQSPHLYQILGQIIGHYPGYFTPLAAKSLTKKWEYTIKYPYGVLLHSLDAINKVLAAENSENSTTAVEASEARLPDDDEKDGLFQALEARMARLSNDEEKDALFQADETKARRHLEALRGYLTRLHRDLAGDRLNKLSAQSPQIAWNNLWLVLKPGTNVYVKDAWCSWYLAKIHEVSHSLSSTGTIESWSVSCWALSSDGANISRVLTPLVTLYHYEGLRDLLSLDVCPAKYWDEAYGHTRQEIALKRGKIMLEALERGHVVARFNTTEKTHEAGVSIAIDLKEDTDMSSLLVRSSLTTDVVKI